MTDQEHTVLQLAGAHFAHPGAREAAIRDQLGMSLTRHAQVVHALLDRPDVEAALPQLVRRLRRLREARAMARTRRGR